jgi:hypothetical protein
MNTSGFSLGDLLSEAEVYKRYKHIFVDGELRDARKHGEIDFFWLRKGIFYTEAQLTAYLQKRLKRPCENLALVNLESDNPPAPGNSKPSGSDAKRARLISIDTSTEEMDALVARALEPKT